MSLTHKRRIFVTKWFDYACLGHWTQTAHCVLDSDTNTQIIVEQNSLTWNMNKHTGSGTTMYLSS